MSGLFYARYLPSTWCFCPETAALPSTQCVCLAWDTLPFPWRICPVWAAYFSPWCVCLVWAANHTFSMVCLSSLSSEPYLLHSAFVLCEQHGAAKARCADSRHLLHTGRIQGAVIELRAHPLSERLPAGKISTRNAQSQSFHSCVHAWRWGWWEWEATTIWFPAQSAGRVRGKTHCCLVENKLNQELRQLKKSRG